jgi:hypothetical protein
MFVRILKCLANGLGWILLLVGVIWTFGALWFDFPWPAARPAVAAIFLIAVICTLVFVSPRWRAKLGVAVSILLALVWWLSIQPRQYRDWKLEVAETAHATVVGDVVTIENVRNFEYRSETDFTPHYETRRFDLRNLRGVDVFVNYWGSAFMAHPIVSFDFGKDGHVCFSIETRPKKGQSYSALGGLYRQFELIYVVADERDVIRLRTNFRKGEDVFLYRLKAPMARNSFMEYIRTVNELRETPRWYNAITNNCTTAIRQQRAASERAPFDWRMLVNGYGDELLYEKGSISNSLPFADMKRISHINERAKSAPLGDFSEVIRKGLPDMP